MFQEILFCLRRLTKRYLPIVGVMGKNDYHFYYDVKDRRFFFVGLHDGEICEFGDLIMLPPAVLEFLSNRLIIDDTINPNLAIRLRQLARQM